MAEEQPVTVETKEEPGVTVEVAPDDLGTKWQKPELTDEEVSKLSEPAPEDEITRYATQAQKRIKSLQIANQELRRRHTLSQKDVATATTLAEQLYRENQNLKTNVTRSEAALIDQAIQRTEAQLASARQRALAAYSTQNPAEIVAANEEVARFVAEADRLRLLKPAAGQKDSDATPNASSSGAGATSPPPAPPPAPPSAVTEAWVEKNKSWWNVDREMTKYAMDVHNSLASQGIGEHSGPRYWGAIEKELAEKFPDRFNAQPGVQLSAQSIAQPKINGRPVAVTGATRAAPQASSAPARSSRHVVLSESQVRIANALGLTPEQYAQQLVKEEAQNARERVQ